jgi:hypothetical protein
MSRKDLPDDSHVLRFVSERHVLDGDQPEVDGAAFRLRPANKEREAESELSINWPKCPALHKLSEIEQIGEAKRLCRMKSRPPGSGFAEFVVGTAKSRVLSLSFVEDPQAATNDEDADPSHCAGLGLPLNHEKESSIIGDKLAQCVIGMHAP